MNDVTVKLVDNQILVSSKQVARDFEKDHKHVLESIRNFVAENSAAKMMFHESEYMSRGRNYPMYLMNRDGFSLLAMGFTGKDALDWKVKYITAFNKMEEKLNNPEFIMHRALELSKNKINQLMIENEELKPKALFADTVSASINSISIGDLATLISQSGINIGQNKLFEWLRLNGYLIKGGRRYNHPTKVSRDLGVLELDESTITNKHGTKTVYVTKVTGKGQTYFVSKFTDEKL